MSSRRVFGYPVFETIPESYMGHALVEELEFIPVKYFKKMTGTDDLWEIRVQSGNNIFRILGFLEKEHLVVLNHAFQKKTQKTPRKDIVLAQARKRDHILRGNRHE
ncbi:MAG: phage-related protein [Gammaproteobacteria bacterium]